MGRKTLTHNEYLASNLWRCGKSPTNAHHWVEIQYVDGHCHTGLFYCKHCGDARRFIVHWEQMHSSAMYFGVLEDKGKED